MSRNDKGNDRGWFYLGYGSARLSSRPQTAGAGVLLQLLPWAVAEQQLQGSLHGLPGAVQGGKRLLGAGWSC